MSLIGEALVTRLESQGGLTALVGTRIYPERLPQNPTYPAIAVSRIASERPVSLLGSSGIVGARYQFDVYAKTYAAVKAAVEQLRLALDSFAGTVDGVVIQEVGFESDVDVNEHRDTEPTSPVRHVAADFEVWYNETKPQEI